MATGIHKTTTNVTTEWFPVLPSLFLSPLVSRGYQTSEDEVRSRFSLSSHFSLHTSTSSYLYVCVLWT